MKAWIPPVIAVIALAGCGKSDNAPKPIPAPIEQPAPVPAPAPPPPVVEPAAPPPAEPPAVTAPPSAAAMERPKTAGHTHVVARGETLYRIARENKVKVTDLAKWNDLSDPSHIAVGRKLRLRAPGT
ncbi:MAG: LysM domain-containing protein [Burkholderiaceae bacterium]